LIKQSSSSQDPASRDAAAQNNDSFSNIPAFQKDGHQGADQEMYDLYPVKEDSKRGDHKIDSKENARE